MKPHSGFRRRTDCVTVTLAKGTSVVGVGIGKDDTLELHGLPGEEEERRLYRGEPGRCRAQQRGRRGPAARLPRRSATAACLESRSCRQQAKPTKYCREPSSEPASDSTHIDRGSMLVVYVCSYRSMGRWSIGRVACRDGFAETERDYGVVLSLRSTRVGEGLARGWCILLTVSPYNIVV